tara:strand:+ start:810 stop:1352 length:543 start_codon:yes stop_codon:yes gene_type:complete
MIRKNLLKKTANKLRNLADRIELTDFEEKKTISIKFSTMNNKIDEVYNYISKWEKENKGNRFIYILKASNKTDVNRCYELYSIAKSKKVKNRAYARINQISNIFYVGSSSSLGNRIKEHLGYGSKGTYALNLKYWVKDIPGGVNILIWRFSKKISQDVIQAIEDGLWAKYKPMFGRQGAK